MGWLEWEDEIYKAEWIFFGGSLGDGRRLNQRAALGRDPFHACALPRLTVFGPD
jgi:hypothetical protein